MKPLKEQLSIISLWSFLSSTIAFLGFVIIVLFQDQFAALGSALNACLQLGIAGGVLSLVGILAFVFGTPKRFITVICGGISLGMGALVYLYVIPNF